MTLPSYGGLIQELDIKNRYKTQADAPDAEVFDPGARGFSSDQIRAYPDYDPDELGVEMPLLPEGLGGIWPL